MTVTDPMPTTAPEDGPVLSVVVPVHDAESTLAECLDSVLGQSLADLEVICVDDGSTDGSAAILRGYAARDPRVRVLSQPNLHAGPARNAGLAAASGRWVHFLDADDRVLPFAYEVLVRKAERAGLDVLRCAAIDWDEGRGCYVEVPRDSLSKLRPGDFGRLVGCEEGSPLWQVSVAPWSAVYRRSFLVERGIRFNDLICVNDRSFFAAVLTCARRTMVARDRLVWHRVGQAGSLRGVRARHFDCEFRSIDVVVARLAADDVPLEVQGRVLAAEFADLGVWLRRFCDGSPEGDAIARQAAAYVGTYDGPFAHLLRAAYRDALRAVATGRAGGDPAPEARPVREACAHPKVSVAVPVCNVEDYLSDALHCLVTQTLDDIEFVCVDDGSTDGSAAILREFAALDGRIRVLSGPNGGYGRAMNRAIDAARGDYLGILEPDDLVPPTMYAELLAEAERSRADLVKADFCRFVVAPDGSLVERPCRLSADLGDYGRVLRPLDEPRTFQFPMNTWSGIYAVPFLRRWHIRHNETPGASYQDNGFWFKTFCRAERALFVGRTYYMNRRDNPNSSMFSRGKMWCVTEEYRLIGEWLDEDPALRERVDPIFQQKRFSNLMVTYRRLAPELQPEYLRHISDELAGPLAEGRLHEEAFPPAQWAQLHEIVADPDGWGSRVRVSAVMPVHDAEPHLREALDGLLARNEVPFELICVDDGSTDGSLAILREYEARDARVRVVSQTNAGAGAARNAGMALARGEYLAFLDADDVFEPHMLRVAYERAHLLGADVVVWRSDDLDDGTGLRTPAPHTIKRELLPAEEPFAGADIELNVFRAFVGWPWDKLFRADFVRERGLRFQELRTTNDALFVFSAIVGAGRICTVDEVLAHHRRAVGSLSVTRERSWWCFHEALLALRARLREWGLWDRREQDFVNYALYFSLWQLHTLRGPAYRELHAALRGGWLEELGVLGHGMDYFYDRGDWECLCHLLELDAEGYLQWRAGELEARLRARRPVEQGAARELAAERRRADRLARELERVRSSTGWRVGRALTWPFRALKRRLQDGPARSG